VLGALAFLPKKITKSHVIPFFLKSQQNAIFVPAILKFYYFCGKILICWYYEFA